jgi:serine phosphatase RsbU (regulator of sigma subunit)
MKKQLIFLLTFTFIVNVGFSQEKFEDYRYNNPMPNFKDSIAYINNLPDSKAKAILLDKTATYYFYSNSDSALYYLKQCEQIAKSLNLKILLANNHLYTGMIYMMMKSNFSLALYYVNLSKKEAEEANLTDSVFQSNLYMQILAAYGGLGSYTKVKKMITPNTLKIFESGRTGNEMWTALGMLGVYYSQIKEYDSALKYSYLAVAQNKLLPTSKKWGYPYYVIGDCYIKTKQYQKAIDILNEGNDIIQTNNYDKDIAQAYEVYARANFHLNKLDTALYYANLSYNLSQKVAYTDAILKSSELLSSIYTKANKVDSAYKYLLICNEIKDVLSDKSKVNEAENITLNEEVREKQILEETANRKKLIIVFSLIFIIGFISLTIYNKQMQKSRLRKLEDDRKNKELKAARDLQESLLPKYLPSNVNLDIATFIRSSTEVGGDYYDFFTEDNGNIYSVCGDATGHGVTSGMMVSITKAGLNGIETQSPNMILYKLNNIIKKVDLGTLRMSLNIVQIKDTEVTMSSAAMPPIYLYKAKSSIVEEIMINGLPLGGLKNEAFIQESRTFDSGDVLVQLSDGLPEAPNVNGSMYDYEQLRKLIQASCHLTAQGIIDTLIQSVDIWMEGQHNPDDITLVVIKKL